ncbi:MAG: DUF116 domain-containing protein [Chitinivibrionales bacterium]|nr:DUF116 domain-containing protein [Chitinivibrionales bacterium]
MKTTTTTSETSQQPLKTSASGRSAAALSNTMWRRAWTKATFLLLCWLSFAIFVGIGLVSFYLVEPRIDSLNSWLQTRMQVNLHLSYILSGVGILCFLVIGAGLFLITITALSGIDLLYPHFKRSVTVSVLFPIAASLSQLLGINRNKLRASFVKVNNALTKAQRKRIRGDRILILLPHCLQIDVCNRKITNSIFNCVQCGKCPVGPILELGKKYHLTFEVVNGGTLARRRVATFKPSGIIAVACERDLTFGIQDVYPIPVYGIINDRPHGPCLNTCVDMAMLETAIRFFKGEEENL